MIPSTETGARPVRVAVIGDLHVGETAQHPYRDLFGQISREADVLVLAGDLTNYGKTREVEILAEDLRACSVPVVAVLGNHDHEVGQPEEVKRILLEAEVRLLDGGEAHEIHGVGFAGCMGAMGGFGRFLLSSFGESFVKRFVHECAEEALKLETSLRMLRTDRTMVVLHYSPVPDTLVGEPPEIFPFLGSSRMAETIDRFDNVRLAVHGHAHRGSYAGRTPRGVPVHNCAAPLLMQCFGRPYTIFEL
jgi:Icc-related predicted phosphoesterase